MASLAPVAVAVAIWAITGSLFALVFAALGPVTALASFVDSKVGGRLALRRERSRFARELTTAEQQVGAAHSQEKSAIAELAPDAAAIVDNRGADPYRWAHDSNAAVTICLGIGERSSSVELQGIPATAHPDRSVAEALARLEATARSMDAPLLADARLGIAVCGPPALTAAWARAVTVQLAWSLAPDRYWHRRWDGPEFAWMDALPHSRETGEPGRGAVVEFGLLGESDPLARVAVAEHQSRVTGGARIILSIDDAGQARVLEHPERGARQPVTISALSREDALGWAERVRAEAVRDGRIVASSDLPGRVELADVVGRSVSGPGLCAPVGMGSGGIVELDLVAQGPHAVVGGTTGSGKSELLIAWVLSMAAMHSPESVNFLLVDFKGGAAFASLESLPHTVGTITDLDDDTARRALESLRAELRFRERQLARGGARSIENHEGMSRLVIVVDEFQAMLADYPELHTLFADIAARGRSLGVHLILCTQRPGGVVRDGVLANADLRISLRVNNRSDSTAVVGVDDAATIPASARGRAVIRVGGEAPTLVQFAIADAPVTARIASAWPGLPEPRRPWREPLPPRILARDLPPVPSGIAIGMLDLPDEQRWDVAVWNEGSGHVLVLGGPRSGKTATLATVADGAIETVVLPPEAERAWHLVSALAERPRAVTLVIDDLDALLARFSSDYRAEFVDKLALLLREGPGWGLNCVASVARMSSELSASAGLFPHRLMLAYPTRNEHVLAGGDGASYREALPPGGGTWKGAHIQVALAGHPLVPTRVDPIADVGVGPLAIVTTRVALVTRSFAADPANEIVQLDRDVVTALAAARGRQVVIADPDQWQAHWGALAAVRPTSTVVFHACSQADFRSLTRSRELPPLLASGDAEECWVLTDDGDAHRARLPLTLS